MNFIQFRKTLARNIARFFMKKLKQEKFWLSRSWLWKFTETKDCYTYTHLFGLHAAHYGKCGLIRYPPGVKKVIKHMIELNDITNKHNYERTN